MATFDIGNLTLAEAEEYELLTGSDIAAFMSDNKPKAKSLRVMMFLIERRTNSNITMEELGARRLTDAIEFVTGDDPKEI